MPPRAPKAPSQKLMKGGGSVFSYLFPTDAAASYGKVAAAAIMVAAFLIILVIVLYMIYLIRNQNFGSQKIISNMINITSNKEKNVTVKPSTTNTVSYSFWIYVASYVPMGTDNAPGVVWMGYSSTTTTATSTNPAGTSFNTISPIVSMDNSTNRMYASFFLGGSSAPVSGNIDLKALRPPKNDVNYGDRRSSSTTTLNPNTTYVTIPIDYVPMQRWVHFAMVVNQDTISVYQDGQVYAVRSASDLEKYNSAGLPTDKTRPLFSTVTPNTIVTDMTSKTSSVSASISSATQQQNVYLSSFLFYNYAISQSDIMKIYRAGPKTTNTWLNWLGIGNFKLQSPIVYEPSTAADSSTTQ